MIYLDNAATTRPAPEVVEAMIPWLGELAANPSSRHEPGVRAAEAVDDAARQVASLVPGGTWEVVFTSGGTESNALAILGSIPSGRSRHVVVSAIEHPSVLRNAARLEDRGVHVTRIAPGADGTVDPRLVVAAVNADTALVSLMHGNNEIGTIQPVATVARAVRASHPGVLVHTDVVQTAGKVDLSEELADVDLISLSAHKMHGPMGTGALLLRRGSRRPTPLVLGGDQQGGLRPGTENVPGIVGFGVAARHAARRAAGSREALQDMARQFEVGLGQVPGCRPGFTDAPRVPGHVLVLLYDMPAEPVVNAMHGAGFVVSSGSACHSRSTRRSHVLDALGLGVRDDALRVVASHDNTPDEMREAGQAMAAIVRRLRR